MANNAKSLGQSVPEMILSASKVLETSPFRSSMSKKTALVKPQSSLIMVMVMLRTALRKGSTALTHTNVMVSAHRTFLMLTTLATAAFSRTSAS